ncbi:MAG: division/cell wall cluster transcriptional repressor MraZ [Acidimicrobiia bacterium]
MFVGRFEHQLDPKGRVVLPSAFRERLAAGGFISQGLDGCLSIWTSDEFEKEAREMVERVKRGEIDRNAARALSANSFPVKPDAQGRIQVPPVLRQYAGLSDRVVVIGAFTSIELWDADTWERVDAAGGQILSGSQN